MIIEASYQDEDVVFELMNELEAGSLECEAFALQYRSCIENENVYIYLYKDDTVKGCITLYLQHYLHHRYVTGEIGELIVKSEYRSQHIGKMLLDHVEMMANKLQLEEIC